MLPWAARWLGDFPKALLPTQTWVLRPCIVSGLLKAEEKLSVVIELGHLRKMCSLCCKCREKANCLQSIPQDSGMDVCECRWMPVCWSLVMPLDWCYLRTDPHHCHGPEAVAISELPGPGWPLSTYCHSWTSVLWASGGTGGLPGVPSEPSYRMTLCKGEGGLPLASEGTAVVPMH